MNIQSLSICVPAQKCINDCEFCCSKMHGGDYEDRFTPISTTMSYIEDMRKRLQYARDNGCNTLMLTGNNEPQQNKSFLRVLGIVNKSLKDQSTIGIVTFDVNDLKYINDNFGHSVGDELIIAAANAIYQSFNSKYTSVYRIGGDEFIAIINDSDAKKIFKVSELSFISSLKMFNSNNDKKFDLVIAYGCSYYESSSQNENIFLDDILKESDALMYEHKKMLKAQKTQITLEIFFKKSIKHHSPKNIINNNS